MTIEEAGEFPTDRRANHGGPHDQTLRSRRLLAATATALPTNAATRVAVRILLRVIETSFSIGYYDIEYRLLGWIEDGLLKSFWFGGKNVYRNSLYVPARYSAYFRGITSGSSTATAGT